MPKSLPEQRKIADILSTWDEALEKLDALIAAKDRRKQALMQQLLTGSKRVKGAGGKWKRARFGDFLTESRIPGTDGTSTKKITVKLYGRGVHAKQERLAGSENTKYYTRKAGQLIYSKLDFLNGAFTAETALELGEAFGVDAAFWSSLQSSYPFVNRVLQPSDDHA